VPTYAFEKPGHDINQEWFKIEIPKQTQLLVI